MKFYSVKVGTKTRAGNINVNYDFVAQSERNQNEVYTFYANKYKGFALSVEEITEIVADEIPKKLEVDWIGVPLETKKIQALEQELKNLKETGFDRFSTTVWVKKISEEVNDKFKEFENLHKQYYAKRDEISNLIRNYIFTTYPSTLKIENISIGEFDHTTTNVPYTVRLNGKLKYGEV